MTSGALRLPPGVSMLQAPAVRVSFSAGLRGLGHKPWHDAVSQHRDQTRVDRLGENEKRRATQAIDPVIGGAPQAEPFARHVAPRQIGERRIGDGRGMAIKGVGVSAIIGAQWLMLRKNPKAAPYAAGANFAAAALTGAIVVHNHMLK